MKHSECISKFKWQLGFKN